MRLKRLEITGFKSFADKSVIDFPSGISAVVGPNGCGKSNIIDAIKWVMGEQSIRQLRGKSMGDVIFSGTEKRAPLNMAEVSLTLANDAPDTVDESVSRLSEIMITRRLFRSGESAYYINKQPCRLKDILNIFLGSGMGARSCAIVQQGNIGAITDALPEDRRAFIEETAGVTRYKTRKQEAVAKLNATRQNLERLEDIVEEITKQMNNLRRQARKAQTYKEFRERVKHFDLLVSAYQFERHSAQIQGATTLLEELKAKHSHHHRELEALTAALAQIQSDRSAKDGIIARKKSEKTRAEKTIDQITTDLKHLGNEEKRLVSEIAGLTAAIAGQEEKNRRLTAEIEEETQKQAELSLEMEGAKRDLAENTLSSGDIRDRLAGLQTALEDRRKQLMGLMAQKAKYQNIYKTAQSNKENLRQRLQRIQKDADDLSRQVASLQKKAEEAADRLTELNDSLESVRRRLSEKREGLEEQRGLLARQVKAVQTLANDRGRVKSEYAALKKMDDNFEWYKEGVKAIMARKGELAGIAGVMADAVLPKPGYELALEAALGETLQYILVEDQNHGMAAIQYLRETSGGRAGFIPVIPSEGLENEEMGPGRDDRLLLSWVSAAPGFEATCRMLLEGVGVAQDLNEAIKRLSVDVSCPKVVTIAGDILLSGGIMTGGSTDRLSGIFEKKRAIRDLEARLCQLDQDLETEKKRQTALEAAVKDLETGLQKLTVTKNNLEKDIREAEKTHYQTGETLKHTRHHHDIITLEREKLLGEKSDIEAEIQAHDQVLGELSRNETDTETDISRLSADIQELSRQMTGFQEREVDLKLQMTRVQAEYDNSRKTLARLQQFQADGARQVDRMRADIDAKTRQQEAAAQSISAGESRLGAVREELRRLIAELSDMDADYREIVGEMAKTDDTIATAKTAIDAIRQKTHELEMELSGLFIKRENVVNRFLERYSQPFPEAVATVREQVLAPDFSIDKAEASLAAFRKKMERIGEVNLGAIDAYEAEKTRYDFLTKQRDDLVAAMNDLENVIKKINRITQDLFMDMFNQINDQFKAMFPRLFAGGSAWLELTQPNNPLETGVELMIHPPGKKVSRLSLLSGGEKALSAIAFIFSIFLINPSSYCLLDEIDAPLDEANTHRFNELLRIIGEKSQIIMISHNKKSMEFSDMLFGVTMVESGVSKIVSVNIDKLAKNTMAA